MSICVTQYQGADFVHGKGFYKGINVMIPGCMIQSRVCLAARLVSPGFAK